MKTSTLLSHENVIEMSWRIAGDLFLIDGLAQQGLILYGATTTEITCFQKNHLSDADFRETVFAAAAKAPIIAAVSVCRIRFIFEPSKHGMKLMDDHDGVVIVVASTRGERRVEVARIFQSGNDVTFGESREWSMSEPSLADEIVAEGVTIHQVLCGLQALSDDMMEFMAVLSNGAFSEGAPEKRTPYLKEKFRHWRLKGE